MTRTIETIVMNKNYLGKESSIAETFGIKYHEFVSSYDDETKCTTIHYIFRTE